MPLFVLTLDSSSRNLQIWLVLDDQSSLRKKEVTNLSNLYLWL